MEKAREETSFYTRAFMLLLSVIAAVFITCGIVALDAHPAYAYTSLKTQGDKTISSDMQYDSSSYINMGYNKSIVTITINKGCTLWVKDAIEPGLAVGQTLIFKGEGTIKRDPSYTGVMFNYSGYDYSKYSCTAEMNTKLQFDGVTVDGNKSAMTTSDAIVTMKRGQTLTLTNGAKLTNNRNNDTSSEESNEGNGGAVFVWQGGGTIDVGAGCEISNCETTGNGGAICTCANKALIQNINIAGTLKGNKAASGGAIYSNTTSTKMTVSGSASITENTASNKGSGIYASHTVTLTGTPQITGNVDATATQDDAIGNIYLTSGNTLNCEGLTSGAKVGVMVENGAEGTSVAACGTNSEVALASLSSDVTDFTLAAGTNNNVVLATAAAKVAPTITAFSVSSSYSGAQTQAVIDNTNHTVKFVFPYGTTSLRELYIGTFTLTPDGASATGPTVDVNADETQGDQRIYPNQPIKAGGDPIDLSSPITIKIAGTGVTETTYTVSAEVAAFPLKSMTLSNGSQTCQATIDATNKTITAQTPYGMGVSNLTVTYELADGYKLRGMAYGIVDQDFPSGSKYTLSNYPTLSIYTTSGTKVCDLTPTVTEAPCPYKMGIEGSGTFANLVYGYTQDNIGKTTFTLTNTGTAALSGLAISLTEGANAFSISKALSATTLAVGESATFEVSPLAGLSIATYTGKIAISADQKEVETSIDLSQTVEPFPLKSMTLSNGSQTCDATIDVTNKTITAQTPYGMGVSNLTVTYELADGYHMRGAPYGIVDQDFLSGGTYTLGSFTTLSIYNASGTKICDLTPTVTEAPCPYEMGVEGSGAFANITYGYTQDGAGKATFTLTNTGTAALSGLTVSFTEGANAFSISKALSATTLAVGESVTFEVSPLAGLAAGAYTGKIAISADQKEVATSADLSVMVNQKSINDLTVSPIANQVYDGSNALVPEVVVSDGKTSLVKDIDFEVVYKDNDKPGQGSAVITCKGNYTGSTEINFAITKAQAQWNRLAGNDRYETAGEIVNAADYAQGGTVIIARGDNYADALAASGLAGLYDAPIILTDSANLSASAQAMLEKLKPSKAIIIGGESAVSAYVESQIKALVSGETERIGGSTRIETAQLIYRYGNFSSDTAIVVSGWSFADALSISSYAYRAKAPIFLVDSVMDTVSVDMIKSAGFSNIIVVGGTSVVDEQVESDLSFAQVTRLAGADRYATSVAVAAYVTDAEKVGDNVLSFDNMAVATGANFPDALAGGAFCGKLGSVMLLVDGSESGYAAIDEVVKAHINTIYNGYCFGGTSAVSDEVYAYIDGLE